jgi:hypothetical protein
MSIMRRPQLQSHAVKGKRRGSPDLQFQPASELATAEQDTPGMLGDSLPAHSTAQPMQRKSILQMQRLHGNHHVQQAIKANNDQGQRKASLLRVQRDGPDAGQAAPAQTASRTGYDAIQDFVEDTAEEWRHNKDHFDLALRNFQRRMTMTSEDEAVPDVTSALVKHVTEKVTKAALDKLETLVPGWGQVKGALDAMIAELERADTAGQEVTFRDFLMNMDRIMTAGFESQVRAIRTGRADLRQTYDSLDSAEVKQMFVDSFPSWLAKIRETTPSAAAYEAELYIQWVNLHAGQLSGYTQQGVIELKFNAEAPEAYTFESAKVLAPRANKVASGLNWILSTPATSMHNVLDLPIRKMVGLYCENIVGGTSYGYAHLDPENNTTQEPVQPVAIRRWRAMPWAPLEAVKRVTG